MKKGLLVVCLFGAALAAAAVPARANQDAVQFFHDIEVTPDEPIHDSVCFFCSVHVNGNVEGDIVVFFGNVKLDGRAHHDVVNFFGNVSAADGSTIDHDLVSFFGSVRLGENVSIGQDMVCMFGALHAPTSVSVGKDRVLFSVWVIAAPFVVIFLIVYFIVHEVRIRRHRAFMQAYPVPPPAPPQQQ